MQFAEGEIRQIVERAIAEELPGLDVTPGSFGGAVAAMHEEVLREVATAMAVPAHLLQPVEYYETGVEGTRWPKGWAAMWRQSIARA